MSKSPAVKVWRAKAESKERHSLTWIHVSSLIPERLARGQYLLNGKLYEVSPKTIAAVIHSSCLSRSSNEPLTPVPRPFT